MGTSTTPTRLPCELKISHRVLSSNESEDTREGCSAPGYELPEWFRKPNMPCLPGFFPVMKETQAGADTLGITDLRFPQTPFFMRFPRHGSSPSSAQGFI